MAENTEVVTKERLVKGYSYSDYVANVKTNKERFDENYAKAQLSEDDRKFFADLNQRTGKIWVLAIAEDWCPDVYTNLPVVQRIVEAAGNMALKVFPRDENLDIMNEYLTNDCMSIPAFAFFDDNLRELGRWAERPAAITRQMVETRAELTAKGLSLDEMRAELRKRMAESYETSLKGETIREIRQVLSK
ncbi:MAG: thioredoxin family protein [Dehalococcoidia bacterium]|nr:thioredoxin family protein [Dehalococcoidia bacterium]